MPRAVFSYFFLSAICFLNIYKSHYVVVCTTECSFTLSFGAQDSFCGKLKKKSFDSEPSRSMMQRHHAIGIARQCQQALVSWLKSVSSDDCSRRVVHQLDEADEISDIWRVAGMLWRQRTWMILHEIERWETGWRPDRNQICDICGLRLTFPRVRVCERVFCADCGRSVCEHCIVHVVDELWCFVCSMDAQDRFSLALHTKSEHRNESNEQTFRTDLLLVLEDIQHAVLANGNRFRCLESAMSIQQRAMMTMILDLWQTTVLGGNYLLCATMHLNAKDKTLILLHNIEGFSFATLQCFKLKGLFSFNKYQRNLGELQDQVNILRGQDCFNFKGKLTLTLDEPLKNVFCQDDFIITAVDDQKSNERSNEDSSAPQRPEKKKLVNRKLDKLSNN